VNYATTTDEVIGGKERSMVLHQATV